MRVATNTFSNSLVDQLNTLAARQNRLQTEAATGRRVREAGDDPAAMQRVLELQAEGAGVAQFQKNIDLLKERAGASFEIMRGLKKISDRVSEIATLADGTKSPQELQIYGKEVTQLIRQAVHLANGKHRGDFLLGGTRVDQPPFVASYDPNGNATGVAFQGNTSVAEVQVDDVEFLTAQLPGANTSGAGARGLLADNRTGADFFAHLVSLQDHLLAGDTAAIAATDRVGLSKDEENLILEMASNGAVQARLESVASSVASRGDSVEARISKEADADITDTIVRLSQTQTAYQAALQSGAQIMGRSLLDYLR